MFSQIMPFIFLGALWEGVYGEGVGSAGGKRECLGRGKAPGQFSVTNIRGVLCPGHYSTH